MKDLWARWHNQKSVEGVGFEQRICGSQRGENHFQVKMGAWPETACQSQVPWKLQVAAGASANFWTPVTAMTSLAYPPSSEPRVKSVAI